MQSLISFFARYKEQYRQNLILALPVVLTQLGQIFTQVVDNLMVGHYGGSEPEPLAAVSFGGSVFMIPLYRVTAAARRHCCKTVYCFMCCLVWLCRRCRRLWFR